MRRALALTVVAVVFGAAACTPAGPPARTFAEIKSNLFVRSCDFNTTCHGVDGHKGNLDLVTDPYTALIYADPDLVGAAKRGWTPPTTLKRIVPGNEMNSFFWIKMTMPRGKDPLLGDHMPDTGQSVAEDTLAQILDWIRLGAPNN